MKVSKALLLTAVLYLIEIVLYALLPYIFGNYSNYWTENEKIPFDNIQGASYLVSRLIAYFIIFAIIYKHNVLPNINKGLEGLNQQILFLLLLLSIGLQIIGMSLGIIWYNLINGNSIAYEYNYNGLEIELIYRSIAVIFLSPVLEELFFRQFLFTKLMEKYTLNTSLIVSSICFSLIHIDSPNNLLPTFILGFVSATIFHKIRSIGYSIVLHLFYNLLWFFTIVLGKNYVNWVLNLNFSIEYFVFFLIGIIFTIISIKRLTVANTGYKQ